MTPLPLARALVEALAPHGTILEPCAGSGSFTRALKPYGRVEWCEIGRGRDFFGWHEPVDWIVTNPPWSQFARFLEHSLALADNVALLATVNHWWTRRRTRAVVEAGLRYRHLILVGWKRWPRSFPAFGFQLGMMHVKRGYSGPLSVTMLDTPGD